MTLSTFGKMVRAALMPALFLGLSGCQNANEAAADLEGSAPIDPSGNPTEVPSTGEGYQEYQNQQSQQQRKAYDQEGYPGAR